MDYKTLTQIIRAYAMEEVLAFCNIMHYTEDGYKPDIYFVAGDPHGVVVINDDYWNMSDIDAVLFDYDNWNEIYHGNDMIAETIREWYYYSVDNYDDQGNRTTPTINLRSWLMGLRPKIVNSKS